VSLTLNPVPVSHTAPIGFVGWNIDSSRNREFFDIDFREPALSYLAKEFGGTTLRFGGAGNDHLTYKVGNYTTCPMPKVERWKEECLNMTHFLGLAEFQAQADMQFVFGVSILPRVGGYGKFNTPWDPTNARDMIQFAKANNVSFYGFELGNEQNTHLTPKQMAEDLAIFSKLLMEEFPDAATRPRMMGPDPHGFHVKSTDEAIYKWLAEFLAAAADLALPLYGITHHEYIEVDNTTAFNASVLDRTTTIANRVKTITAANFPSAEVWAGEIGPHNGGSPKCDHTAMNYATFADSVWYADALGSKALAGYQRVCRQDFVGADYGMVDCSTHTPLPDYYTGLLFKRLMGPAVLSFTRPGANTGKSLRAYAHCAASGPGVTVLLINLEAQSMNVTLDGLLDGPHLADAAYSQGQSSTYTLTAGHTGPTGPTVALNGKELVYQSLELPKLEGVEAEASATASLPAESITFIQYPGAKVLACGSVRE
jgi:heparanase 1